MLSVALGECFGVNGFAGSSWPCSEGLAMESGEMGLSESTPCLAFTETFNATSSHLCHHHQNESWPLRWKEGQPLRFTAPWRGSYKFVATCLKRRCWQEGWILPEKLLSSTLTVDISRPLAVYRWWFAVSPPRLVWLDQRTPTRPDPAAFCLQEEDQCPAVITSAMLSVTWPLPL